MDRQNAGEVEQKYTCEGLVAAVAAAADPPPTALPTPVTGSLLGLAHMHPLPTWEEVTHVYLFQVLVLPTPLSDLAN